MSEQKMIRGARILLETLKRLGVTDIFGYPGGAVIPIYNEIYDLVRAEILNKTGNKETSTEDLEADELDLGIENLGEVE